MRVYKVGAQWYADIRGIEGVQRTRRPVGPWAALTEEQARVAAYQLAAQLKDEAARARVDAGGLHAATAVWLRLKRRGRSDESICRAIALTPDEPVKSVNDAWVATHFGHLGDANYDRHVSTISSILRAAGAKQSLSKRRTPRADAPRFLTQAEWIRLREKLPEHLRAAASFALATGLRRSNVFGLRWRDVNLANRTVTVWARRAKGRRTLHLPLSPWAVEVLQGQQGLHEDLVFPYVRRTKKRTIARPMRDPKTAFAAALEAAKITDFDWHDLRHTWATWAVQDGVPLKVLQELGGWASLEMVMVYAHSAPSHLQHWVSRVQEPGRNSSAGTKARKAA